eukprot:GEMP01006163.1.p1 GENE.GEMP01006163.1~~GEMP01006163.1.p1  ORF type:complete len:760 (+),score=164.36 GEMP01006163.1:908-3187(+)
MTKESIMTLSDEESEEYDAFNCSALLAPPLTSTKNAPLNSEGHVEFIFVVDISGSMRRKDVNGSDDRRIDVVVRACQEFVEKQSLESPNDRYSLIHFNDSAERAFDNVSAGEACEWFSQNEDILVPRFGTDYYAALKQLSSLSRTSHLRVLFLSDGRPKEWSAATLKMFQWVWLPILDMWTYSLEIHCIGFGPSALDFEVLQQISQFGRGTTQIADLDVSALRRGFTSISTSIITTRTSTYNLSKNLTTRSISFAPPPRNGHAAKAVWLACKRVQYSWDPTTGDVRIDEEITVEVSRGALPYAQGNMRFVFDMCEEGKMERMVAKESKLAQFTKDEEVCFAKSSACTAYFATMFREQTGLHLRILPCHVYCVVKKIHRAENSTFLPCFCGERFVAGVFAKWISNSGYISDSHLAEDLASFAHFTHHHSGGKLMVSDLQGVFSDGCYTLTDPQVLSIDKRFGRADLGFEGMQKFLAVHKCGPLCRSLNIATSTSSNVPPRRPLGSSRLTKTTAVGERVEPRAVFTPTMFFLGECALSFSRAAAQLYTEEFPNAPIKYWYLTELQWPERGATKEDLDRNIAHFEQTFGDAVQVSYPESVDATKIPSRMHDEPPFDRCIWSMPYPDDFSPKRTPINSPALKAEMRRRVHGFVKAAAPLLKPSVDACVSVVLVARQHVEWGLREPVQTEQCGMLFPEVHVFRLQELLDRGYVPRFGDDRDAHGRVASYHHGSEAVVVSWRRLASPLPSAGGISDTKLCRRNNI